MRDLHELPKLRDSLSYLYIDQAVINKKYEAVEAVSELGAVMIPAAVLSVLMLGPGTSITHAAVKALADNGCTILWVGEECTRFYAFGTGETRKAYRLLRQAELVSRPELRKRVVLNMYRVRFEEDLEPTLTLPQIRGYEGVRVRKAYAEASKIYGVEWKGRHYNRADWHDADPVNRALSAANALLNGICHAAIVSGGYSAALGFVHTGRQLSFVYDIADLYKVAITIPAAFETISSSSDHVDSRVREICRERFKEAKLLEHILPDIDAILELPDEGDERGDMDDSISIAEELWDAMWEGEDLR